LQEAKALKQEADQRAHRVFILSQKLTRTRHTLGSLQSAQADYHSSAQKVQAAESKLSRAARNNARPGARRLSASDAARVRAELDQATTMMSAAFHRVEQIEGITDSLIQQLADAEAELAEVQALRQEESAVHADEIGRLMGERDELAARAEAAARKAEALAAEMEASDKARSRGEVQRATLAAQLQELLARQDELAADLERKEGQLAEAMQKASEGTPVGRGAKVVLPMALQRIRETQDALRVQEEAAKAACAELERLTSEKAASEAALQSQLQSLDAERQRQVAEKQASLESMTRAAAAATKEAAIKQEAVNKLATEVSSLDQQRRELQSELDESTHRCLELEAELSELTAALEIAIDGKEAAAADAALLQTKVDAADKSRHEVEQALKETRTHSEALECSIMEMKSRLETASSEAGRLREQASEAETQAAVIKQQLKETSDAHTSAISRCDELENALAATEVTVKELTSAMAAALAQHAELESKLAVTADSALDTKNKMMQSIGELETQLSNANAEKERLSKELIHREASASQLETSVVSLQQQLAEVQARNLERIGELAAAVEDSETRHAATTAKLQGAIAAQEGLVAARDALQARLEQQDQSAKELSAALEARIDTISDMEMRIKELQEASNSRLAVMQTHLNAAVIDRDRAQQRCHDMESNLAEVQAQLVAKQGEIQQALERGSASDELLKISFDKIRAMQTTIEAMKTEWDDASRAMVSKHDKEVARLHDALKQREEMAAVLEKRMAEAIQAAETELEVTKQRLACEEETVAALKSTNENLAPQVEMLVRELHLAAFREAAMQSNMAAKEASAAEDLVALKADAAEASEAAAERLEETVAKLHAAIKERDMAAAEKVEVARKFAEASAALATVRQEAAKKESAGREIMHRAFDKIKCLQRMLGEGEVALRDVEARLECAEDNAKQLADDVAVKTEALMAARHDNALLESMVCRLRCDAQAELEARKSAETEASESTNKLAEVLESLDAEKTKIALVEANAQDVALRAAAQIKALEESVTESERHAAAVEKRVVELQFELDTAIDQAARTGNANAELVQRSERQAAKIADLQDAIDKQSTESLQAIKVRSKLLAVYLSGGTFSEQHV
jgi:chromosome segregation ATPase